MEPPGSGGAEEPGQGNRIQEPAEARSDAAASPASNAAPAPAAVPPPHPATAAGGADGDSAAAVDPKGKQIALPTPPSSSDSSADYGEAFGDWAFETGESSSSAAGADRKGKMPAAVLSSAPSHSSSAGGRPDYSLAFGAGESSSTAGMQFDYRLVFGQLVQQQQQQLAIIEEEEEQVKSSHAKDAASSKGKEKLPQVKARSGPEKGRSLWSQLKNKIFRRDGRHIHSAHVQHQTHPISEVTNRYMVPSDGVNNLDGYSEFRPVIGDGECFYRSFIFSYLEQVIDRQDTDEEHRLLDVVERVSTQHANLRWNSEFPRSSRAFKKLIKKVMKWKRHGRRNSMESTSRYRKEKLLKFFSTYDKTKDIFVFLRLVVATQMCSDRDVYEPLIVPPLTRNYNLEHWCCRFVIPAHLDADHPMIIALATALEVPLRVETFRREYARDIYTGSGAPRVSVTLLYTGGHYDIIYRAPCAESSGHQAS